VLRVIPLSREHDRNGFDCGAEPLNLYLRRNARQHADKGIARTFVLVDEDSPSGILGFFTLTFCNVESTELPARLAKKLPTSAPALKLARLAILKSHQGQGLGGLLLSSACRYCEDAEAIAGGIGLFVDAKDERAARFYSRFGFTPLHGDPLTLFLPMRTIREHNAATR